MEAKSAEIAPKSLQINRDREMEAKSTDIARKSREMEVDLFQKSLQMKREMEAKSADLFMKSLRIKVQNKFPSTPLPTPLSTPCLSRQASKDEKEEEEESVSVAVAVPFTWESQPGTPKITSHQPTLRPLTPPPSYYSSSTPPKSPIRKYTKETKTPKSPIRKHTKEPKLINSVFSKSKTHHVPPSPASSPSLLSDSSAPYYHGWVVDDKDHHQHDEHGSPVPPLCFSTVDGTNPAAPPGCYSALLNLLFKPST